MTPGSKLQHENTPEADHHHHLTTAADRNGSEPPRKRQKQSDEHHGSQSPAHDNEHKHTDSESPQPTSTLYRQPACQRCRSKKIKCDALSPQCTACKRAGENCTIANPTSHQEYQRGYVESLEDRIQQLQSYLSNIQNASNGDISHLPEPKGILPPQPVDPAVAITHDDKGRPNERDPRFIGEGSGIGFINSILAAIRTRHSDINLLRSLLSNKKKAALKASVTTKSQFQQQQPLRPSIALGNQLLGTYLEKAQVRHPFIARSEIARVCENVMHQKTSTPQDLFRAYMVFAIGSAYHFRNGDPSKENVNPMKYYAVAMQYIDHIPRLQNIDGVTNILFIARLGFFCATGLSLWYISNICLRICIENEMHLNPSKSKHAPAITAFEEQMRRRVFWSCYSLDRHASQTLGRPFGIADEDVKVDLPVDVDDVELMNATTDLSTFMTLRVAGQSSEMAFFLHNLKLKTITSQLNSELYTEVCKRTKTPASVMTSPGVLYMFLEKYIGELEKWRAEAPMSPPAAVQPTSQGIYTAEWHDLHLYQEKISLVRAIIDQIQPTNDLPPSDLMDMCYTSACHVIRLYQKLSLAGEIEPARGRLYRVFVAGISVLYCLLLSQQRKDDVNKQFDPALFRKQKEMLKTCQTTLEFMAKPLIDDGSGLKYVRTFEVLCREVIRRVNNDTKTQKSHDRSLSSNMHVRQMSLFDTECDGGEFGGASPPAGYEKMIQQQQLHHSEASPHSANSWPMASDFTAGEIGDWMDGANNNGGGGGGLGKEDLLDASHLENGVTGGYDYDIEGLGAEWANFLEILMDGRQ